MLQSVICRNTLKRINLFTESFKFTDCNFIIDTGHIGGLLHPAMNL